MNKLISLFSPSKIIIGTYGVDLSPIDKTVTLFLGQKLCVMIFFQKDKHIKGIEKHGSTYYTKFGKIITGPGLQPYPNPYKGGLE